MSFTLTNEETTVLATHQAKLDLCADAIEDAIREYNDALEEAKGFLESVTERLQEQFDGMSKRWMESEQGDAADTFIRRWSDVVSGIEDLDTTTPADAALNDLLSLPVSAEA
jgi:hypothetical protein